MDFYYVVSTDFDDYTAGTRITDPVAIETILNSLNAVYLVRVSTTDPVIPEEPVEELLLPSDRLLVRRGGRDRLIPLDDLQALQLRTATERAFIFSLLNG